MCSPFLKTVPSTNLEVGLEREHTFLVVPQPGCRNCLVALWCRVRSNRAVLGIESNTDTPTKLATSHPSAFGHAHTHEFGCAHRCHRLGRIHHVWCGRCTGSVPFSLEAICCCNWCLKHVDSRDCTSDLAAKTSTAEPPLATHPSHQHRGVSFSHRTLPPSRIRSPKPLRLWGDRTFHTGKPGAPSLSHPCRKQAASSTNRDHLGNALTCLTMSTCSSAFQAGKRRADKL
jgi:hypothetical protein